MPRHSQKLQDSKWLSLTSLSDDPASRPNWCTSCSNNMSDACRPIHGGPNEITGHVGIIKTMTQTGWGVYAEIPNMIYGNSLCGSGQSPLPTIGAQSNATMAFTQGTVNPNSAIINVRKVREPGSTAIGFEVFGELQRIDASGVLHRQASPILTTDDLTGRYLRIRIRFVLGDPGHDYWEFLLVPGDEDEIIRTIEQPADYQPWWWGAAVSGQSIVQWQGEVSNYNDDMPGTFDDPLVFENCALLADATYLPINPNFSNADRVWDPSGQAHDLMCLWGAYVEEGVNNGVEVWGWCPNQP